MVSFSFGWRHVVGLWLRCMTWRWLISLNSISLYSALLLYIYIYILYIVSWQFVECSKPVPFLAGTCCNWRVDWLVDYSWKWPLTLCAIVPLCPCDVLLFLWGSCVWMYCLFYISISSHSRQQCFAGKLYILFYFYKSLDSLQKGPFLPSIDSCLAEKRPRWPYVCEAN